jgi:hypothetical protein
MHTDHTDHTYVQIIQILQIYIHTYTYQNTYTHREQSTHTYSEATADGIHYVIVYIYAIHKHAVKHPAMDFTIRTSDSQTASTEEMLMCALSLV